MESIVTRRIKCLKGWQMNAILQVWEHLKSIRQQGNSDNLPTVQFTCAFRKLFFSSVLDSSKGNCDCDLDTLLAEFSYNKSNIPVLVSPKEQPNTLDICATDYRDKNVNDGLIKANAICYVAGYRLMKCLKRHTGEVCNAKLTSNTLDDNRKLFCHFKVYQTDK